MRSIGGERERGREGEGEREQGGGTHLTDVFCCCPINYGSF